VRIPPNYLHWSFHYFHVLFFSKILHYGMEHFHFLLLEIQPLMIHSAPPQGQISNGIDSNANFYCLPLQLIYFSLKLFHFETYSYQFLPNQVLKSCHLLEKALEVSAKLTAKTGIPCFSMISLLKILEKYEVLFEQ